MPEYCWWGCGFDFCLCDPFPDFFPFDESDVYFDEESDDDDPEA